MTRLMNAEAGYHLSSTLRLALDTLSLCYALNVTVRRRRASRWLAASWLFGQLAMAVFTVAALDAVPVRTMPVRALRLSRQP